MKFITDGMLGKLTRWLRMLGHNVKYSNNLNDVQLMEIARKERRILLTRDLDLYQQALAKGISAFFVEGSNEAEKLANLAKRFGFKLDMDMNVSRCPKCNARVKPVSKEKVAERVAKTTFSFYDKFWECAKCGQIYWQGAHWERIDKTLEEAKVTLEKK